MHTFKINDIVLTGIYKNKQIQFVFGRITRIEHEYFVIVPINEKRVYKRLPSQMYYLKDLITRAKVLLDKDLTTSSHKRT